MAAKSQKGNDGFQKGLSLIVEAKEEDASKRTKLEQLLSATAVCLNGMERNVYSVINDDFRDIMGTLEERVKRLQQRVYYILVAGESSAGKSSLINLLLGEDLLPYSVLSTTSTICELKYGEQPKLVLHFKNMGGTTNPPLLPKAVRLTEPSACGKSYRDQIAPHVHLKKNREKGSKYERVEIFWPHELLKVGVVIIDSPGVGESDKMDQTLMTYLPNAFAFLYVISSTNAGGIQKDRLVKILDKVRLLESDEVDRNRLAECALFVINKWDQVPECEQHDVKEYIVEKLKKFWPDGNPHEQCVYISTTNARAQQKCGEVAEELDTLLKEINSMVLKAIHARLYNHWRWMKVVVDRIIFRINGFNESMLQDRETLVERMDSLHTQITILQYRRKHEITELEAKLKEETNMLATKLFDYLCSPQFQKQFFSWTTEEIPYEEDTWEQTEDKIEKTLQKRFENCLTKWEETNAVHAKVHNELVQCFRETFRIAEADLRDIEEAIHSRNSQTASESGSEPERASQFTVGTKVLLGATSPLWITLGVASLFLGLPVLAIKAARRSFKARTRMNKFRKHPNAYLTEKCDEFLKSVTIERVQDFIKEQMHVAEAMLQEYVSRIPRMLEANRKMVTGLLKETRSRDEVWKSNLPVLRKCVEIQNLLAKFGILIWKETISPSQLIWGEDDQFCIGEGEFSSVYSGTLATKYESEGLAENCSTLTIVAIKVFKKPFDSVNANYFLKNESKLRELRHENICKFFGAVLMKDLSSSEETKVALVMEIFHQNLRSVIFRDDFTPPVNAVVKKSSANARFLKWAVQIAQALTHIHSLKLVHKHLKLENILVGGDESAKLSDIGIVGVNEVSDRSMVYAAPEVLQTSTFSTASDVYSFGLVLWEMWYGGQVFSEIMPLNRHEFLERLVNGYRPRYHDREIRLAKVQTIVRYCWAGQKEMRLTASQCCRSLADVLKEVELKDY